MKPATQIRAFFVREDVKYDLHLNQSLSETTGARVYYLVLHLLPGLFAYLLINVPIVYVAMQQWSGMSGPMLQAIYLATFSCLWHLLWPFISLVFWEGRTIQESFDYLGLRRFDPKGVFVITPIFWVAFVGLTFSYVVWSYPPIHSWLESFPILKMPEYSIFKEGRIFTLPIPMLAFLAIGNYIGEEVYYRGYLLKKIGFLGSWAWVVNSVLFGLYHLWQVPETWPIIPSTLFFGLLMQCRKNLYPLVIFHILVNLSLGPMIGTAYSMTGK